MTTAGENRFWDFLFCYRYETLLVSFFILLFGDLIIITQVDLFPFLVIQNVIASFLVFHKQRVKRVFYFLVIAFLVLLEVVNVLQLINNIRIAFFLTYIIYFAILSLKVYQQILFSEEVSQGMIAAVLCGFIILGLIGGFVFSMIELVEPGSFNNIAEGVGGISDLLYFSFVTILSIGYGDITPATDIAQKSALLFGLVGYFYGVVVIGVIIGKYLAQKNNSPDNL
ncbi:MAG TPA: ion channel [Draconibacterium sp.]|nr:ion channel [Draconibacterium sp.]